MQTNKAAVMVRQRERDFVGRISQLNHVLLTLQPDRFAAELSEQDSLVALGCEGCGQNHAAQWQRKNFAKYALEISAGVK